MKKSLALAGVIAAGLAASSLPANATVVTIDLTDAALFGGAQGSDPFGPTAVGPVWVTLDAIAGGLLTFNAADNAGCLAGNPGLHNLICGGDGIGIADDEVSFPQQSEELQILLNGHGLTLELLSIEFLDLFNEPQEPLETAQYTVNGVGPTSVGSASNTGGYVLTNTAGMFATSGILDLRFFTNVGGNSDFSVARLTVNAVPEPAALGLMGLGLIGLGALRRRRRT